MTTRRTIIVGAAALMAVTSGGKHPDAELLAAFARWLPLEQERVRAEALRGGEVYPAGWFDAMAAVMRLPVRTQEGAAAQARVMRTLL